MSIADSIINSATTGNSSSTQVINGLSSSTPNSNYSNLYQYSNPTTPSNSTSSPLSQFASNSGSIYSAGKGLFSTAAPGSISGNLVNQAGSSLGLAPGLQSIPTAGMSAADTSFLSSAQAASGAAEGSLGTSATLSGVGTAAALGYFGGGMLGKAIGGSATGGSIGGALGAGAGMAFGAAGAAALGLELGAFAGPVGALVGGIGGAVFGSFFGNKSKPTNADTYYTYMAPDGTLSYRGEGSKNPGQYAGFGKTTASEFGNLSSAMSKDLGIQFPKDSQFSAGISTEHGGAYVTDNNTNQIFFDAGDEASKNKAFLQALETSAKNAGYTDMNTVDTWFNNAIASKDSGNTPNIPNAKPQTGPSKFDQFVAQYKADQNANAAPSAA